MPTKTLKKVAKKVSDTVKKVRVVTTKATVDRPLTKKERMAARTKTI